MKALLSLSALALILTIVPASAMCGGGASKPPLGQCGGMICGRPAAAAKPFGDKPAAQSQAPQQSGIGMCPCCRGMAMMGGGAKADDDVQKGMDTTPKQ